eukprot:scaffold36991_cov79-Cyclotella_meneghiniana.AAC.7
MISGQNKLLCGYQRGCSLFGYGEVGILLYYDKYLRRDESETKYNGVEDKTKTSRWYKIALPAVAGELNGKMPKTYVRIVQNNTGVEAQKDKTETTNP